MGEFTTNKNNDLDRLGLNNLEELNKLVSIDFLANRYSHIFNYNDNDKNDESMFYYYLYNSDIVYLKSNKNNITNSELIKLKKTKKEEYLKFKTFKEKIENIKEDKNSLKKVFEEIINKDYYELANFLIEKTDVDVSELFELMYEKWLKNTEEENKNILKLYVKEYNFFIYNFLLYCNYQKNCDLTSISGVKDYFKKTEEELKYEILKDGLFYDNSNYIGKVLDKIIKKNQLLENEDLLKDLVKYIIRNNKIEIFKELLFTVDNKDNNKKNLSNRIENLLNSDKFFTEITNYSFKENLCEEITEIYNIEILDLLFQIKPEYKISKILDRKQQSLLLEYFTKNNTPEKLKEKIINEFFSELEQKNESYYIFENFTIRQGKDQIKNNRVFEYDKNTNSIKMNDRGYSLAMKENNEPSNELVYNIDYNNEENKQIITYYAKGSNGSEEIATATINLNEEITFKINNNYDLETLQKKVNEIMEDNYKSVEPFDFTLSYLNYAPLQLQQSQQKNKKDFVFKICNNKNDTEAIMEIADYSSKEKYKNKTILVDFRHKYHNVIIIINNGKITIVNTEDSIKKEIEEKGLYNWYLSEKIILRLDKDIDIREIHILKQLEANCVAASKLYNVALAMQYTNDFETFTEYNEKLNKIGRLFGLKKEDIPKEKIDEKQIKNIKKLSKKESDEYFKLMVTISKVNYQLLGKSKHFTKVTKNFRKFRNNFIKEKYGIKLLDKEKNFIKKIKTSKNGRKFEKYSDLDYINYYIKSSIKNGNNIEENNKEYTYINSNNEEFKINGKIQTYLIAIKLGDIELVKDLMEELKKYTKNTEELFDIKENIIDTHFKDKNPYIEEVINKIEEELDVEYKKNFLKFNNEYIKVNEERIIKIKNGEFNRKTIDYINVLIKNYNRKNSKIEQNQNKIKELKEISIVGKEYSLTQEEFEKISEELNLNKGMELNKI